MGGCAREFEAGGSAFDDQADSRGGALGGEAAGEANTLDGVERDGDARGVFRAADPNASVADAEAGGGEARAPAADPTEGEDQEDENGGHAARGEAEDRVHLRQDAADGEREGKPEEGGEDGTARGGEAKADGFAGFAAVDARGWGAGVGGALGAIGAAGAGEVLFEGGEAEAVGEGAVDLDGRGAGFEDKERDGAGGVAVLEFDDVVAAGVGDLAGTAALLLEFLFAEEDALIGAEGFAPVFGPEEGAAVHGDFESGDAQVVTEATLDEGVEEVEQGEEGEAGGDYAGDDVFEEEGGGGGDGENDEADPEAEADFGGVGFEEEFDGGGIGAQLGLDGEPVAGIEEAAEAHGEYYGAAGGGSEGRGGWGWMNSSPLVVEGGFDGG